MNKPKYQIGDTLKDLDAPLCVIVGVKDIGFGESKNRYIYTIRSPLYYKSHDTKDSKIYEGDVSRWIKNTRYEDNGYVDYGSSDY